MYPHLKLGVKTGNWAVHVHSNAVTQSLRGGRVVAYEATGPAAMRIYVCSAEALAAAAAAAHSMAPGAGARAASATAAPATPQVCAVAGAQPPAATAARQRTAAAALPAAQPACGSQERLQAGLDLGEPSAGPSAASGGEKGAPPAAAAAATPAAAAQPAAATAAGQLPQLPDTLDVAEAFDPLLDLVGAVGLEEQLSERLIDWLEGLDEGGQKSFMKFKYKWLRRLAAQGNAATLCEQLVKLPGGR